MRLGSIGIWGSAGFGINSLTGEYRQPPLFSPSSSLLAATSSPCARCQPYSAAAELVDPLDPDSPIRRYSRTQCSRCPQYVPRAGSVPKICRSLTFGISLLKDTIFLFVSEEALKRPTAQATSALCSMMQYTCYELFTNTLSGCV